MGGCAIPPAEPPPGLEGHELFSTSDPLAAARLGSSFLGRHRYVPWDLDPGFSATLHAAVTGAVTVGFLSLGAGADVVLQASGPRVLVVEPGQAGTAVQVGRRTFEATPTAAVVVVPGRPTTLHCPANGSYRLVGIEEHALLVHLSRLLGRALDRTLVFDPVLALDDVAAGRWRLAVDVLLAELAERTSLLRAGIGADQLEEFLMSALLYGHRSTYTELLRQPGGPERRAVTVARDFIEANLSDRLPLGAVAAAAGVSVRTLQVSFRSELRTTPTTYIRSRRLDRAHGDLCDPQAPGSTVTDVATRWGITHLGRFAADYRTRYGESPSETLRRQRR